MFEESCDSTLDHTHGNVNLLRDQELALQVDCRILIASVLDIEVVKFEADGHTVGDIRVEVRVYVHQERRRLFKVSLIDTLA